DDLLTKYPADRKRSAVLAALYLVQEQHGHLTANGMRHVAEILDLTPLEFECLGACDRAPIVMVNNEHWHEKATAESCGRLVDDLKARGEAALSGCHLRVE